MVRYLIAEDGKLAIHSVVVLRLGRERETPLAYAEMSTRARNAARRLACLVFVLWALLVALSFPPVYADDDGPSPGSTSSEEDSGSSSTASSQRASSSNENDDEADWGSFYDPNNVFCGQHDCYKILGFDFLNWGSDPPSLKDITKSYRSLSRRWHPDKNKAKGAREKFVVSFNI